ncbi:polyribonucleotide nucleotidyltransferase [Micractinium conductrix]|uniref:polyribonucleotide nucleotidyltransferase n=1 Tax=Micractinium conductrix TaxID=554055 RepID=A0A2P6V2R8_9CHLO|nr:polyribonucleotide nucleotidyltransferase [Micractinium conductrix]|eukprot:PSC68371.1 polyribonucleotide nucleotidyltransferase [Micractinium conductrix]
MSGRATALRRCATLLARGCQAQLEREAGAAAAACELGLSSTGRGTAATTLPAVAQRFSTASPARLHSATPQAPADAPLREASLVRDDIGDALRGEAEAFPLSDEEAAAAAASAAAADAALERLAGQHLVPTDAIATLPRGQSLRQEGEFQGQSWAFETGKMARLANGSCMVQAGGTSVLAAATAQAAPWSRRDAYQLQFEVEYREKLCAVGRIPSTYNKREGAAKEHEVLAARRIDRALRPLFPRGLPFDAALFANVLSADGSADPDVMAISAASAALMCSDLPWAGPVAAARVAVLPGGELVVGPSVAQQEAAALTLLVAATAERVTMLEAEGAQIPEAEFMRALRAGVEAAQALVEPQRLLAEQTGRSTRTVQLSGADPAAARRVTEMVAPAVEAILRNAELSKSARIQALQEAKEAVLQKLRASGGFRADFARVPGSGCVTQADLEHTFRALVAGTLRRLALDEGWRCDGRGGIDVRSVHCEVDVVPVVHGSALFSRGETQSLCTATVGRRGEQQKTESLMGGEGYKRIFVNYSFPAYAVGETSIGGMRREWGHSELCERALLPVLPAENEFPFSLRINAETLASAGSSSMAAVSGGALALADAGVPLKALVAGISVGLFMDDSWDGACGELAGAPVAQAGGAAVPPVGRYELLTDLQGIEDQTGGMDLKVAGTRTGITACQLDVKLPGGVPLSIVEEALAAAARGRAKILSAMEAALPEERSDSSPTFGSLTVPAGMVGRVIGSGGSNIRQLEEEADVRLDVDGDSGRVAIYAPSQAAYKLAASKVQDVTGESVKEGEVYRGTVTKLFDYGALVTLADSGARALLHISEISPTRVRSIEEALSLGQELEVMCLGRDARGMRLSRKAVLARADAQARSAEQVQHSGGVDADNPGHSSSLSSLPSPPLIMASLRSSLALALVLCVAGASAYYKGDGTAYSGKGNKNHTGFNSCQFGTLDSKWETLYAALPSQVFNKDEDCGKCIKVRGTEPDAPGKWVTIMVVDECASCEGDGDVDFSDVALEKITGYNWDRKGIEWDWVDCEEETKQALSTQKSRKMLHA